jgi:hypothetical protein
LLDFGLSFGSSGRFDGSFAAIIASFSSAFFAASSASGRSIAPSKSARAHLRAPCADTASHASAVRRVSASAAFAASTDSDASRVT